MNAVLVPLKDALESYRINRKQSPRLWLSAVELLQTCIVFDEGGKCTAV